MVESQAGRRFRPTFTFGSSPQSSHKDLFSMLPNAERERVDAKREDAKLLELLELTDEIEETDTLTTSDAEKILQTTLADSIVASDERALAEIRGRLPEL